mmetsp:Transcript_30735/g.64328  ORF Transcript_30735/g.64328 Transcript_30735/m.64328 type:complete len:398 (-) Transcript_30735:270-1463(-)
MKQKKKNSKKPDQSSSVATTNLAPKPLPAASSDSTPPSIGEGKDAPSVTVTLPSELGSPSRAKLNASDKNPLRRINELQEHDSLTPTTSNSDFLNAGGWDNDQNSELLDGQPPPRIARISFSEPPEDLASLDFESMQLPPMDPTAKPSTSRYSLHFLLTSPETLPPVTEFCPRQNPNGRLQLTSMRDRPLHAPLAPGTPTRAQALMAMRDGPNGTFTAGFLERTGFAIPPELDPDIPSRRESNLSQADLDADQDAEDGDPESFTAARGSVPPAPPATPGTPVRTQRTSALESPARSAEERAATALDHARLVSALGALAECGDEEERGEDNDNEIQTIATFGDEPVERTATFASVVHSKNDDRENSGAQAQVMDGWVMAGMALSFAVVVGVLLLRPRP